MTKQNRRLEITEEQFAFQVEDLLGIYRWRWCHFRAAKTEKGWRTALSGYQGFPDYIAVRGDRLLFAELKSEKGKVSPAQEEWIKALIDASIARVGKHSLLYPEVYVWRPSDFEKVAECLR